MHDVLAAIVFAQADQFLFVLDQDLLRLIERGERVPRAPFASGDRVASTSRAMPSLPPEPATETLPPMASAQSRVAGWLLGVAVLGLVFAESSAFWVNRVVPAGRNDGRPVRRARGKGLVGRFIRCEPCPR
jgi:hypothetical protein